MDQAPSSSDLNSHLQKSASGVDLSERTKEILGAIEDVQSSATPEALWDLLPLLFGEEPRQPGLEVFEALAFFGSIGFDPAHRSPSAAVLSRISLSMSALPKEEGGLYVPITIPLVMIVDREIQSIEYEPDDITAFARWLSGLFSDSGLDFSINHSLYSASEIDSIVIDCHDDTPPVGELIRGSISPSSASDFPEGKVFYQKGGYAVEGGICDSYLLGVARFTKPSEHLVELLCGGYGLTFPEGVKPEGGDSPLLRSSITPIRQVLIGGITSFMLGRWQGFTFLHLIDFVRQLQESAASEGLTIGHVLLREPVGDLSLNQHLEFEVRFDGSGPSQSKRFHVPVGPIVRYIWISDLATLIGTWLSHYEIPFTSFTD